MREIWAVDTETDPFKKGRIPEHFICGAYCLELDEYHEFASLDDLLDFFLERGKEVIFYAHNGGKFDWHFILHRLENFEPVLVIAGRIAKFKIGCVEFRDSYSILPVPLGKFQKQEFDYSKLERDIRHRHMEEIRAYLKSDCVNLAEFINAYVSEYGLNLTLASGALKFWRNLTGHKTPETSKGFYDEIAPYYAGGRVQAFETGKIKTQYKVVDINSAYPFAMLSTHPWGSDFDISDELPETEKETARCFIRLEGISRGALPLRDEKGKLHFPSDGEKREYKVTGHEYLAGIRSGALTQVEVKEVRRFHASIDFASYVSHFYELKRNSEKDSAEYLMAKLFLNSLYGKYGANPEKYKERIILPHKYIEASEDDGYEYEGDIGKKALMSRPLPDEKARYLNVATAASITGFVRAYLFEAMTKCRGVMYCDTDSIICRDTGNLELDGEKLGAWDVEASGGFLAIAGRKMYALKTDNPKKPWKTASKGARLKPEDIVKVAAGEVIRYEPEAPTFSLLAPPRFIPRKVQIVA